MKMKKSVRIGSLALCCAIGVTVFAACNDGAQNVKDENTGLPAAPDGAIVNVDGTAALLAGGYRLDFVSGGVVIRFSSWTRPSSPRRRRLPRSSR